MYTSLVELMVKVYAGAHLASKIPGGPCRKECLEASPPIPQTKAEVSRGQERQHYGDDEYQSAKDMVERRRTRV